MSLGQSLDSSLNCGKEIRFKQKYKGLMDRLAKETHLSYLEVEQISIIYYKLQLLSEGKNVPVQRNVIREVLHNGLDLTEYEMMPYILSYHDKSLNPHMTLENWIKMMSLYLRGSLTEKINYCYMVYKSTGLSDYLLRNNMINLLKHSLIKDNNEDDEEAVKDMVDMLIKRMDNDRDGKVSLEDFRKTVMQAPGFLESFGPVLPSRLAIYAFKQTVMEFIRKK